MTRKVGYLMSLNKTKKTPEDRTIKRNKIQHPLLELD